MAQIDQIQSDVDKLLIAVDTLTNNSLTSDEFNILSDEIKQRYYDKSDIQSIVDSILERLPDLSDYVTETELTQAISDLVTTEQFNETIDSFIDDIGTNFLKQVDAQNIYLSKTDANSTYATKVHSHDTNTIQIAGTQNSITAPIKTLANAITNDNFYHIFQVNSTTTMSSDTVYNYSLGDLSTKPYFTNGSLCTVIINTSTQVDRNIISMMGSSGSQLIFYDFVLEQDGTEYVGAIPNNSYVLCLMDVTNEVLKIVGIY